MRDHIDAIIGMFNEELEESIAAALVVDPVKVVMQHGWVGDAYVCTLRHRSGKTSTVRLVFTPKGYAVEHA